MKGNIHSINGGFCLYTHLEEVIYKLYKSIGIMIPEKLDMHLIAKRLGIKITYEEEKIFRCDDEISLTRGTKIEEWLSFAHELGHYLRHAGMQLAMHPLFRQLQEYQASSFTYHFCVPTFMLDNLKEVTIRGIMNLFNVDYDFACKRLEMYQSKMYFRSDYFERTRS